MPPHDEWYLPVGSEDRPDSPTLYVKEVGRGSAVIVLHGGFGAEHSYLESYTHGLTDDFRFIFYDQRGSLRSPCRNDCPISIDHHVEDLDRLRDALGLNTVILFAHSMGTRLAYEYLERHPERVAGLVLHGAVLPRSGPETIEQMNDAAVRLVERPEVKEELRQAGLDRKELSPKESTHAWRIRFASSNLYHAHRWRYMPGGEVFYDEEAAQKTITSLRSETDFVPVLRKVQCPIIVLNGDHDYVDFGNKGWHAIVQELPRVRLVEIEKAGHFAVLDAPAEVRTELERSLREVQSCKAAHSAR